MNESPSPLGELRTLQRAEQLQRMRVALFAVPLLIGILLLVAYAFGLDDFFVSKSRYTTFDESAKREPLFAVLGVFMLAASGLGALMLYLQTGFRRTPSTTEPSSAVYTSALKSMESYLNEVRSDQEKRDIELSTRVDETRQLIQAVREEKVISLTPGERQDFLALLRDQLHSQSSAETVESLKKAWTHDLDRNSQVEQVSRQLAEAKKRLTNELDAVNRRGNLNLSIGIVTTISGLAILGLTVFDRYAGPADPQAVALHYLPRLSLVLFIEVFAYFFLRLYKASLAETKYFQNELTNIESRFTALVVALHRPQEFGAAAAVEALARTERNFLLKQGESTVELEGMKLESDRQKGLISELRAILRRDKDDEKQN